MRKGYRGVARLGHRCRAQLALDGVGGSAQGVVITAEVALLKGAFTVRDEVLGHLLVTTEVAALNFALGGNELGEHMGVQLVLVLVPEELLAGKTQAVLGEYAYTATQFPHAALVKVVGGVALDVGLDMELLVKLFQEEGFVKNPTGGAAVLVDFPPLGDDAVLDDTRVGDKGVDTIRDHHGDRVAGIDGRRSVLSLFLAGRDKDDCKYGDKDSVSQNR